MTLPEIAKYRLINQQITPTKLTTATEMVAWLGAVQGQEYAQSKWAVGLRTPNLTDVEVENDLSSGKIIRTHILRPTWHFVAAQDIYWMMELSAPRVHQANAYMYRKYNFDASFFNQCNDIIIRLLQEGNQLTRQIISQELEAKLKLKTDSIGLSLIMMQAELDCIICSGARQGNQFTYALLEERVPKGKCKTKDEALAELSRRYFRSHGPATIKDFSTWSGLTTANCKKGLEMVKSEFVQELIEGEVYHFSPNGVLDDLKSNSLYLLPIYDEYIMGYKSREAIFQSFKSITPKPVYTFDCTIVFEGQIIGTWKRTIKSKSIQLEFSFFNPLSKIQKKELDKTILRFQEFTGLEVEY